MYRPCRWYDPYPRLVFVLNLIKLLSHQEQVTLGEGFTRFLQELGATQVTVVYTQGHRWYDGALPLGSALETLKMMPSGAVKQASKYLLAQTLAIPKQRYRLLRSL